MRFISTSNVLFVNIGVLLLGTPLALAKPHVPLQHRHPIANRIHDIAQNVTESGSSSSLAKRVSGAKFTNFAVGLGACGATNTADQYVVALSPNVWDGGSHCFETITITIDGVTTSAQVVDLCAAGCIDNQVDMSNGLFTHYAPLPKGLLFGEWFLGSAPTTTTSAAPKPPPPTTTFTWTPTSTSTTSTSQASTTSSSSSSSTSSSSTSASGTSSSASSSSLPAASPASSSPSNLGGLDQYVLQMGGVVVNAANQGSSMQITDN